MAKDFKFAAGREKLAADTLIFTAGRDGTRATFQRSGRKSRKGWQQWKKCGRGQKIGRRERGECGLDIRDAVTMAHGGYPGFCMTHGHCGKHTHTLPSSSRHKVNQMCRIVTTINTSNAAFTHDVQENRCPGGRTSVCDGFLFRPSRGLRRGRGRGTLSGIVFGAENVAPQECNETN